MKKDINNKVFLAVPNEIMSTKHDLHKHLLDFDSNIELKIFLALLAKASMIYKSNKPKGIQTFSIKGFLSNNSFIPRKSLTKEILADIINEMTNPFFEVLFLDKDLVSYKLSTKYTKTLKSGFQKVNLMSLKSHKDLKMTKLAILTAMKPNGYLNLNYVLECLKVNKKLERTEQILQVKKAFRKLKKLGLLDWEYIYPVNKNVKVLPEHYKFHYKATIKDNDTIKENESTLKEVKNDIMKNIDKTFNEEEFDLDTLLAELKEPVAEKKNDDELYDIPF